MMKNKRWSDINGQLTVVDAEEVTVDDLKYLFENGII